MKKHLKWIIPVAVIILIAVGVLVYSVTVANSGDKELVLSLEYEGDLVNSAETDLRPVTYGSLAFVQNGMVGSGLEFLNGYLEITASEDFTLDNTFSFMTWIKVTDTQAIDPILFCRKSSDGNKVTGPLNIHFSDGYNFLRTDLTFNYRNGEYKSYSFASKPLWSIETVTSMWHHIAIVFDSDTLKYYVDGNLVSSEKLPEEFTGYKSIANNGKTFSIGEGEFDNMYAFLDETKLFTVPVSESVVKELYNEAKKVYKNTLVLKPGSDDAVYNGKNEKLPVAITRDTETERLMVPLRYVIDKMGGTISWDGDDGYGRADILVNNTPISIWMMDTNALANHKYCKLDAYPQDINDVMCVPIRFVAEELGASVNWNEEKEEVIILF